MNEGVAGREGGGSGGMKHHGDECEWVQRREAGFVGLEFKSVFCGTALPQDTLQDTVIQAQQNVSAEDACGLHQTYKDLNNKANLGLFLTRREKMLILLGQNQCFSFNGSPNKCPY